MTDKLLTREEMPDNTGLIVAASWGGDRPGLDGTKIYVRFDKPFPSGSIISYNLRDGVFLHIGEVDGELSICKIVTTHPKTAYLPEKFLAEGLAYFCTNC